MYIFITLTYFIQNKNDCLKDSRFLHKIILTNRIPSYP